MGKAFDAVDSAFRGPSMGYHSVQNGFSDIQIIYPSSYPFNWDGTESLNKMVVAVSFSAASLHKGIRPVFLDLNKVFLIDAEGKSHPILKYGLTYPNAPLSQGCGNGNLGQDLLLKLPDLNTLSSIPPSGLIEFRPYSWMTECMNLLFDVARISSDQLFSIQLNGVFYEGKELDPMTLRYSRGYGTAGF